MSAEAQDVVTSGLDEKTEILKKVNRMLRTIGSNVAELVELMEQLSDAPGKKRARETDDYGDPTWSYLVKCKIPKDFRLTRKFLEYGAQHGFNEESMRILMHGQGSYSGFIPHYRQSGKKWQDWTLVFFRWVRTERERKDKARDGVRTETRFDRSRTRG